MEIVQSYLGNLPAMTSALLFFFGGEGVEILLHAVNLLIFQGYQGEFLLYIKILYLAMNLISKTSSSEEKQLPTHTAP